MQHLGDITKINGCLVPAVDCVIGGSPCQDLSVAGKREGLAGERSGLFMEQIRIIKEMRQHERDIGRSGQSVRPRFMVWENVPGAFSSNKGRDFAAVLEETIRIAEPKAPSVPVPEKGWPTSGCFMGDGWSVAWRVLDAQFWGVPQRRRRIALVADFGGQSAAEILFVRKSLSGDIEQGKQERKEAPGATGEGAGSAGKAIGCDVYNLAMSGDKAVALTTASNATGSGPTVAVPYTLMIRSGCAVDSKGKAAGKGALIQTDKTATLSTVQDQTLFQPVMSLQGSMIGRADKNGPQGDGVNEDVSFTLNTTDRHAVVYGIGSYHSNAMKSDNPHSGIYEAETSRTLDALNCGYPGCNQGGMAVVQLASGKNAVGTLMANAGTKLWLGNQEAFSGDYHIIEKHINPVRYIVRRLTPLECERLQGYPDGWTDIGEWVDTKGKKHKEADSPRYKALGNSIAIPPWKWVLKRLCACYERDATMASLFDGIGGFPYIWEQLNGKGSCLWASEIEEFPIAVTKLRFGGE